MTKKQIVLGDCMFGMYFESRYAVIVPVFITFVGWYCVCIPIDKEIVKRSAPLQGTTYVPTFLIYSGKTEERININIQEMAGAKNEQRVSLLLVVCIDCVEEKCGVQKIDSISCGMCRMVLVFSFYFLFSYF